MEEKAALKMTTDLNDCADAFVMIAKNTSMTGQKIAVGEWCHNSFWSEETLTRRPDAGLNVASM